MLEFILCIHIAMLNKIEHIASSKILVLTSWNSADDILINRITLIYLDVRKFLGEFANGLNNHFFSWGFFFTMFKISNLSR